MSRLTTVAAFLLAAMAAAAMLGLDRLVFDTLLPHIPGEQLQALGVYAARGICATLPLRRAVLPASINTCDKSAADKPLRVVIAVPKGGSVFGARVSYFFAWECGWCPGFGHNTETTWPAQPDFLPTYPSDMYMAIPSSAHWEQYAYANQSRPVKCVVLTRDPIKVSPLSYGLRSRW